MTAHLPDYVVIGAPRSGTTTLEHWLRQHPEIAFSDRKELEFFDLYYDRGLDWYLEQLPAEPGDRRVVEATPSYLSDRHAADRIAATLPEARFVVTLREPVARAWSQYWFFVQLGLEKRSWQRALAEEVDGQGEGYLWRGRYAQQLARWDALVGQDRLHVLLFDDLTADPDAALGGVCDFMGVTSLPAPSREAVNPTRLPRSAAAQRWLHSSHPSRARSSLYRWNSHGKPVPALARQEKERLHDYFADDLSALPNRLGRPLPRSWFPSSVAQDSSGLVG